MDENNLFLKTVQEKYERFCDYYMNMHSDFLSIEHQSLLSGFLRTHMKEGVYLFGGYGDAERQQVVFLPDYSGVPEKVNALAAFANEKEKNSAIAQILLEYFAENPDDCPICLLEVSIPPAEHRTLGHRDYLGALIGEGIRREKIGDIIVAPKGAQIIVAAELGDYLAENFRHAGSVSINVKKASVFTLNSLKSETKNLKFTLSSPRLDNITAGIFGISRKDATEAISRGKVFVNGREISKPDFTLKGGEKVVLRGKGKAIYNGISGESKKGKLYVNVDKYV